MRTNYSEINIFRMPQHEAHNLDGVIGTLHLSMAICIYTVDPRLSELIGTWVFSDNWIIEPVYLYTELYLNTLIKRMILTKCSY